MTRTVRLAAAALAVALSSAGCAADDASAPTASGGKQLAVVTSFYPLQFVAERVGGSRIAVENLTKPGGEPHDLELTAQDVRKVAKADLVVYLKGFQPAVDDAIAQQARDKALEVSPAAKLDLKYVPLGEAEHGGQHGGQHGGEHKGAPGGGEKGEHAGEHEPAGEHAGEDKPGEHHDEHEGEAKNAGKATTDPHFWLDPTRLAAVADALAERLAQADSARADAYRADAKTLRAELEKLDAEFRAGLRTCAGRSLVTSHNAFGYLANRYGLRQVGIAGLSPESEPSPRELGTVTAFVRANRVRTIYYETLVSPDVARTVAAETGARTAVLDPLEGLSDASAGRDYPSVMRANLETLRKGQPCS